MSQLFVEDRLAAITGLFAQVAPERGLDKAGGLTYVVPAELADLRIGERVRIPLRRGDKPVSGHVLGLANRTNLDARKLKAILARDRRSVSLPDELVELARWISRYYCCPLGMVLANMLPAAVK